MLENKVTTTTTWNDINNNLWKYLEYEMAYIGERVLCGDIRLYRVIIFYNVVYIYAVSKLGIHTRWYIKRFDVHDFILERMDNIIQNHRKRTDGVINSSVHNSQISCMVSGDGRSSDISWDSIGLHDLLLEYVVLEGLNSYRAEFILET